MSTLDRGANILLSSSDLEVAVTGAAPGSVDLLVFQIGADGKVRSDADMVFFNQPRSPEGAVELTGPGGVRVCLTGVPAAVTTLVVSVALDDSVGGSLSGIAGLAATVSQGQQHSAPATGLTTERAAILVEIYRRGDGWKLRNVSAGWDAGLAALAREYGVQVEEPTPEPPAAAPSVTPPVPTAPAAPPVAAIPVSPGPAVVPEPAAPTAPAPAQGPRSVPGEEKLSLVKRQQLDLRKNAVHQVLLTKNATGLRARVVLVLDKTGSMSREYKKGVVHRVVERMVPVAIQLDDDGSLECYLYAESFFKLPDLQVAQLDEWIAEYVHLSGKHGGIDYRRIGGVNDEIPILTEIIGSLTVGDPMPTLVLFFTDGGFHRKKPITDLIVKAAALPAFWQFVGIGKAGAFGILEKLDDMEGRVVDNVGFFPVKDVDALDDAQLYQLLLSEFPDWLAKARSQGIVG
ncbi:vWA domain-containing protein [Nakamurella lactea]|uniref:vWA domain-containing protein n=1 Tax=Nakamurella lactea TaxID=459515 RepID=UPI00048A626D|nr:VWA domain-containing protein [Nakamurella lactea]